jgi:hypothetical protein
MEQHDGRLLTANARGALVVVAVVLAIFLFGCGKSDDTCSIEDEFLCCAIVLDVPDSIDTGQPIDAFVSGYAGGGCSLFDRVEQEMVAGTWVLRPIGRREQLPPGTACTRDLKPFQYTVALAAPDTGWAYIEVQSSCPALLDSTYVRP